MVTISTGGRGTSEKGFFLKDLEVFTDIEEIVAGGASFDMLLYTLTEFGYYDLLLLVVTADEVPASPPAVYNLSFVGAGTEKGFTTDLSLGTPNMYELDLSEKRFRSYFWTVVARQTPYVLLTAHGVNQTTFKVNALVAKYKMPS